MYISVRDDIVFACKYPTLAEGLKDLNINGIELFINQDYTVPAIAPKDGKARLNIKVPAELAELKNQASANGVTISALCMGNDFNADDKQFQINWAVATVRACEFLGAPAVRIDAIMHGEKELPLEERQRLVAESIKKILAATADSKIELGIENHGFQGNDPEFINGLLNMVDSPRLGLTLDSGNFYWRGWPLSKVYEIFAEFATRVKHTHIKNIKYPAEIVETMREMGYEYEKYVSPIHEGDIDHKIYIDILKAAGYDRDICLEDESLGKYEIPQRRDNIRIAAETFRKMF